MVYLFVVKFDMVEGFNLIHISEKNSSSDPTASKKEIIVEQLEHRAIPSGLHFCESDTIRFLQLVKTVDQNGNSDERVMKAIAFFRQNGFQLKNDNLESTTIDRAKIKMFSVGILYDEQTERVLENTMLAEKIKAQLTNFINQEISPNADIEQEQFVTELSEAFNGIRWDPQETRGATEYFKNNVDQINQTVNYFGPFIFRIWRALLTGKKVLLENDFHKNKGFEDDEDFHGPVDINTCLIEVLEECCNGISSGNRLKVDFLYNLTLHDLSKVKKGSKGYIASTSEELLVSQWNMTKFDYLVTISGKLQMVKLQKVKSNSSNRDVKLQEVKFTATDMAEFLNIMGTIGEGRGFVPLESWRTMADNSWLAMINGLLYGSLAKSGITERCKLIKDVFTEDSPWNMGSATVTEDGGAQMKHVGAKHKKSEPGKFRDELRDEVRGGSLMGNDVEYQLDRILLGYLRVLNGELGEIQRRGQIAFATAAKMGLAPLAYDDYEFCVNLYNRWVAQQEEGPRVIEVDGNDAGWFEPLLRLVWN